MLTAIATALLVGVIVGALGRVVPPGRGDMSVALLILVGVLAALGGTALALAVGRSASDRPDVVVVLLQVSLSVVAVGLVAGRRGHDRSI